MNSSPLFGIVIVDKPCGMTSHDVVAQLRRVFNIKQVGHLGTLDPEAEGVLPVCIGSATRLIEYFPNDKRYVATAQLGFETLTLDRVGQIIAEAPVAEAYSDDQIHTAVQTQVGAIEQRVPRHSAVHYKGKKLYHYAHDGILIPEEELPIKPVEVFQLQASHIHMNLPQPTFKLHVHCGGGTYIRCLVRDIAKQLGTLGTMMALRRTQHGLFHEREAIPLATLQATPHPESYLQDPLRFLNLPCVRLKNTEALQAVYNGMPQPDTAFEVIDANAPQSFHNNELVLLFTPDAPAPLATHFVGVAVWHNERLRPKKVFHAQGTPDPQGAL